MGRVLATAQEHSIKISKAEIDAVIAASPRTTVPFNKLVLSPGYQARLAGTTSRLSVAELAASIQANDLFHNLIVVKGARGLHAPVWWRGIHHGKGGPGLSAPIQI